MKELDVEEGKEDLYDKPADEPEQLPHNSSKAISTDKS